MMYEGFNLMLYGMGTVFVFLTLLVLCTLVMSTILARFFTVPENFSPKAESSTQQLPDQRLISVIEAAIARHRQPHRKK